MPVLIAMLRGVNVGGNHKMPMLQLRELCERLGFRNCETFIQSGNVVFEAQDPDEAAQRLETAIEGEFGFASRVVIRTVDQLRSLVHARPFGEREEAKSLVTFLSEAPEEPVRTAIRALPLVPPELWIGEREIFCFHPNGQGKSTVPMAKIERLLGCAATTRNWNTVVKLLALAEGHGRGSL